MRASDHLSRSRAQVYATDGEGTAATELISGALGKERVKREWNEYDTFFTQAGTGDGVAASSDKTKAPRFVDKFYNLVGCARRCAHSLGSVALCCRTRPRSRRGVCGYVR